MEGGPCCSIPRAEITAQICISVKVCACVRCAVRVCASTRPCVCYTCMSVSLCYIVSMCMSVRLLHLYVCISMLYCFLCVCLYVCYICMSVSLCYIVSMCMSVRLLHLYVCISMLYCFYVYVCASVLQLELPDPQQTDNLATMSELTEEIVLESLEERYSEDQIYVSEKIWFITSVS